MTPFIPEEASALSPFVEAGILGDTEIHFAATLGQLHSRLRPTEAAAPASVLLAAALAVRAPLHGSVCVDLSTVTATVTPGSDGSADDPVVVLAPSPFDDGGPDDHDDDLTHATPLDQSHAETIDPDQLPWPDTGVWLAALAASPLVRMAGEPPDPSGRLHPLVLDGDRLYLARYHQLEEFVARALGQRAVTRSTEAATEVQAAVAELFERGAARAGSTVDPGQLAAAAAVVERDLVVVSGGPGTGKTTTVARLLAGLVAGTHRAEQPPLRVALAAPTGKAAARMTEAVRQALTGSTDDLPAEVLGELTELEATTLHRLLGTRSGGGFRHGPENPLAQDVVIVDEVSMVSLSMMGRLLAAIGPSTKLVLVGDPHQLVSVEAGTVLGDVVQASAATEPPPGEPRGIRGSVRPLTTVYRQAEGSAILDLAHAIREGRTDGALEILEPGSDPDQRPPGQQVLPLGHEVRWIRTEDPHHLTLGSTPDPSHPLSEVHQELFATAEAAVAAAIAGHPERALEAITSVKVLCAHRRGLDGVEGWNQLVDDHLRRSGRIGREPCYPGRPTMVTANDYLNEVFNGDVGVAVPASSGAGSASEDRLRYQVWFERAAGNHAVEAVRLDRVATQWAMSVHKSQGSEFPHAVVVLPVGSSRILTRELLYTAVTRARERLTIIASESAIRAAINRPVARASGLTDRLR